MNKKLILWISAFIITFLITFLHQRLNPNYPVSGSFSIGREKVTYAFDKIHRGTDSVKILIRTDKQGLAGDILWRKFGAKGFNRVQLKDEGNFLSASIPPMNAGQIIEYRAEIISSSETFLVPRDKKVTLYFSGKRPSSVMNVFYFFLFGGLLLTARGSLEYFNPQDKRILFSILIFLFLFVAGIIFYPFIKSYELGAINKYVPDLGSLFDLPLVLMSFVSFIAAVVVFRYRNKLVLLISGVIIIVIYQFSNFY